MAPTAQSGRWLLAAALAAACLAAAAPLAAASLATYATDAIVSASLKQITHDQEGADFVCPQDMYAIYPAINVNLPLSCGPSACEDLRGKVALITGGSTGIGRGTADRLVAAGMKVVATSRTPEVFTQPCPSGTYVNPGDRCAPVGFDLWQLDQTSQASVDALIQKIKAKYGRIDFLFCNAGRGAGEPMFREASLGPLGSIGYSGCDMLKAMELEMQTNFWGAIRVWMAARPLMPTTGYSRVVLTSSVYAPVLHGSMVYTASKRGVEALAEAWMTEWDGRPSNVKVTTLYPGNIRTDVIRDSVLACRTLGSQGVISMIENQAYRGSLPFMTASQAGESLYRIAVDANPPKRVLMANQEAVPFFLKRICRHWSLPMERWVPVGWNRAKANGTSASSGLSGMLPTVWGS